MHKGFLSAAALIGAIAVILGAFGAHALKAVLDEQALITYETAVRYQFYHVFALALTGILYGNWPDPRLKLAGRFFITGIVLFSGSLYLLTYAHAAGISGLRFLGPVTPLGGAFLIAGWLMLFLGIRKK
ncbi:DUF423 domain-containing protein [Sediminibacterium ginsengisoli]|uniref:Uncharacterized membrane protein YgdD, TMEM256/DUF423 family n=1 Tax=Sediminibacterium ginsengisoli TaxID=413434 RepID=A0A1T4LGF0_9BACT|nr:DUF423 domain-containing protein [Sediminibacterium ginsengisoli]SJZ53785.1 Uncharacterized membrane protein YgdD, TMEM256/DUF423 family [Sediminibacterium ginsengisoli]